MDRKTWIVSERFLVAGEGWKLRESNYNDCTLTEAHYIASEKAKALDREFGSDHFWTVDIYNAAHREDGSAAQLFHGRLI